MFSEFYSYKCKYMSMVILCAVQDVTSVNRNQGPPALVLSRLFMLGPVLGPNGPALKSEHGESGEKEREVWKGFKVEG